MNVKVRVPATSANMGPGFDNLGIALTLYNTFEISGISSGLIIEGCPPEFRNADNLVYTAMMRCFDSIGFVPPGGIRIRCESDIPVCSGLGSSSSCIVAGILAANQMAGKPLSRQDMVNLATEIEGHPDNVAPAFLGNMVIAVRDGKHVFYNRLQVATGIHFIALTPDFDLPTEKARAVLPRQISFDDAVFNVGRTGLLISSLVNGKFHNLSVACQDRLHQPYRERLVDEWDAVMHIAGRLKASAAFLSGAGPTIMLIFDDHGQTILPGLEQELRALKHQWTVRELRIDWQGAKVLKQGT